MLGVIALFLSWGAGFCWLGGRGKKMGKVISTIYSVFDRPLGLITFVNVCQCLS